MKKSAKKMSKGGKTYSKDDYVAEDEKFDESISNQTGYKKRPAGIADALKKSQKPAPKKPKVKPQKKV